MIFKQYLSNKGVIYVSDLCIKLLKSGQTVLPDMIGSCFQIRGLGDKRSPILRGLII
jgi:hypothetical protein